MVIRGVVKADNDEEIRRLGGERDSFGRVKVEVEGRDAVNTSYY
jgi:hypothetical protein